VLTFNVKEVHAHDVAQILDSFGIAVRSGFHCAQPLAERLNMGAAVRASFYVYNTKEEIDFLIEKIPEVLKVFKIK
jgi:cysteine desulfurase / selenocysteine lyase